MERDFDFSEVSDFKVLQTSRYEDQPKLKYSFCMKTEELISKAGGNYMLDIGKLIEKQVKIDPDELERNYGIYMNSPRIYSSTINVKIQEGYMVQGLDNLTLKLKIVREGL